MPGSWGFLYKPGLLDLIIQSSGWPHNDVLRGLLLLPPLYG